MNGTTNSNIIAPPGSVLAGILFALLVLIGIVGNILVMPAIVKTPEFLRLAPYKLMLSLAVADLLAYICFAYAAVAAVARKHLLNYRFHHIFGFSGDLSWFIMHWHLLFAAINRLVCVVFPTYKQRLFSTRYIAGILPWCWVVGFCSSLALVVPNGSRMIYYPEFCYYAYDETVAGSFTFIKWSQFMNYFTIAALPMCYVPVFWKLRETRRNLGRDQISSREAKLALQFLVQYVIYSFTGLIFPVLPSIPGDLFAIGCVSMIGWICVAITDPWVYLVVNARLRTAVWSLWCCKGNVNRQVNVAEDAKVRLLKLTNGQISGVQIYWSANPLDENLPS